MSSVPQYAFKAEDLVKDGRTTATNIQDVKRWMDSHPHIPQMSEEQIALFLIACNNEVEATQTTIGLYFKHKASSTELFTNRDIEDDDMQFTNKVTSYAFVPKRTKENYAIIVVSLKDSYYYNFNLELQTKMAFICIDRILYLDPPDGLVVVLDFKEVGIMHLTRMKLGILRKMFSFLQEALPTQLKQIHILNASYTFEKLLAICKPFMKKELYEMIPKLNMYPSLIFFRSYHTLPTCQWKIFFEKFIPASCMPSDFGGDLPPSEQLGDDFVNSCKTLKTFHKQDERQIQLYIENTKKK
ncbi:hypothetical protein NQ317_008229 [Molorchus minor]|uniref:CRAL-TRIO domain-containing protein n=1 Tax=Molorchus minor TaxID=1323400 RepID=A0ABQ9JVK6_9CUCU|nr:hypothetical protein NQ317_008229 [Molorchus minor]